MRTIDYGGGTENCNGITIFSFLAFFKLPYQYWLYFWPFSVPVFSFYQLRKIFQLFFLLVAVKISCPLLRGLIKVCILKMVLCYLNFIQPYCVLRYLVSHTSSDCTSVSVAQNHLEYSSTKIMCERILHMRGKTANREKNPPKIQRERNSLNICIHSQ